MGSYELFKRKFDNLYEQERKRLELKEAAISTRSALRYVAYNEKGDSNSGKIRAEKNTHRGVIHIQVDPGNPTSALWLQHETTTDYLSLVRYRLAIDADGSMIASRQTLRRTMNEVPIVRPLAIRLGGYTLGFGPKFAHIDTQAYKRLEKGLDPDRLPQPFTPTVDFLESLKRDILRNPYKPGISPTTK